MDERSAKNIYLAAEAAEVGLSGKHRNDVQKIDPRATTAFKKTTTAIVRDEVGTRSEAHLT